MTSEAKPSKRSWLWLQGALAGGFAVAVPGPALLIAVLLCPAVVVFATDRASSRAVVRTMLVVGSSAVFSPLHTLWDHGNTLPAALDMLADPGYALLAWIACATGWFLCVAGELGARLILNARTQTEIRRLRREEADLGEEWTLPRP